jgi:sugar-specific transcriptional regulator TrmB
MNCVTIYYIMEHIHLLRSIGLNPNQSKIYLTLLDRPGSSISEISHNSGIQRPIIYKEIPHLLSMGLILESVKGQRKSYFAESPEKLNILFKLLQEKFNITLPQLLETYEAKSNRPKIKAFTGLKGVRAVYLDLLASCKRGETFYRYESPSNYKKQDKYLPKVYFEKVCNKKELQKFVITNELTSRQKPPQLERAIKSVPRKYDAFIYDISLLIYANKIALIDFNSETAYIIESELLAQFQKQIFRLLFYKL